MSGYQQITDPLEGIGVHMPWPEDTYTKCSLQSDVLKGEEERMLG